MIFKREYRYLLFIGSFILLLIAGMIVGGESIPLPPLWIFAIFWFIWGFFEILGPIARGQTPQLFTNTGHYSIRNKDIHRIPLGRKYVENEGTEDEKIVENVILYTFAFTGGIEVSWWIPESGKKEDPVFIFPSMFEGKIGPEHASYATTFDKDQMDLMPKIREILIREYPKRVDKKTPIRFGMTSPLNKTSTEKNISLEQEACSANREANETNELLIRAYEQNKRGKEAYKNEVYVGDRVKRADEP